MYVSVSSTCLHCVCFDFFCNTAEALSIEIISWYITCVLLFTRYLGCEQEETPQGQGQWLKFFRSFQATRPLNSEAGSAECECSGVSCSERVFYLWVKEIDWTIQHSATSAAGSNGVYCWPFFDRHFCIWVEEPRNIKISKHILQGTLEVKLPGEDLEREWWGDGAKKESPECCVSENFFGGTPWSEFHHYHLPGMMRIDWFAWISCA